MTMSQKLRGKSVAILVADGFEQKGFEDAVTALQEAGAITVVVSPSEYSVKGCEENHFADSFDVNVALEEADAVDYDALFIPDGALSVETLRMQPEAVLLVRAFFDAGKPIAAVCHAP